MDPSGIDTLFTAVDVSGINTNVSALLLTFVGINLLFLGYKYVRRVMGRG